MTGEIWAESSSCLNILQERVSLIGVLRIDSNRIGRGAGRAERSACLSTLNREIARPSCVRTRRHTSMSASATATSTSSLMSSRTPRSPNGTTLVQLFEHILATGNMGMVVGDGKQAIYRWRNGNYEQLEALPKLIGDPGSGSGDGRSHFGPDGKGSVTLGKNFRSGTAIVELEQPMV